MADIFQPKVSELERAERELKKIENEVVTQAYECLSDAGAWADIDPGETECPPEWVEKLGIDRAARKFRVARAAWMSAKTAPVALSLAKSIMTGAMRAAASAGNGPKHLNINLVSISAPMPQFPEKKLDE